MLKNIKYILLLGILILLTACSTSMQYSKDGPPAFHVDVSKIPNATPKPVHKSKYGNPKYYVVHGHRYYVLKTSEGYHARGLASWYGTKFHRRRTSSGEPYNMFGMTAASRNLPIPCYAEVTNLRNGRKVIVKVNDRGPFKSSRIMDLSYVAAKKLGITSTGTARVDIKTITVEENHTYDSESNYETTPRSYHYQKLIYKRRLNEHSNNQDNIYLQVGAFNERNNALHVLAKVKRLTAEPGRIKTIYAHGETQYKVQIGPLANLSLKNHVEDILSNSGIKGMRAFG